MREGRRGREREWNKGLITREGERERERMEEIIDNERGKERE